MLRADRTSVVKVGGSLLDWPELPRRLVGFLETLAPARPVLVVGGGGFADVVRTLDRIQGLGEAAAHHLALRSLDLSAHVLARLVPGVVVVETIEAVEEAGRSGLTPAVSPRLIMEGPQPLGLEPLPANWRATTDSIAARLATILGAEALWLLKSAPAPEPADRREAARVGYVDPVFPSASAGLADVRAVHFRANPSEFRRLT